MSTSTGIVSHQALGLDNPDLRPLRRSERTWTWWNYSTIWMGIVHNLVAWQVAANLIAIGMSFWEALACVVSAYLVAFLAILANSVLGAKYGLSFPVLIRAAFGRHGAQIPVFLRAFVAIFWFAVHIYIGSKAIGLILSSAIPGYAELAQANVLGMGVDVLIAFVICWLVHAWVLTHGIGAVKRFEAWAGPTIMVLAIGLVIWAAVAAGSFGALFDSPTTIARPDFWPTFFLSMTALIGTVATLVLNISDLTRFSRSQRDQSIGQGIGFPLMFFFFSLMALWVAVGTKVAYGEVISDPIEILARFDNPAIGIFSALCILVSTVSVNVATNGVSVGFDLTNLFPRWLTFSRSGIIAIVAAIAFVPWLWYGQFDIVETILGAIGATMGPIAGIMLVDYYFIRRRDYDTASLFTESPSGVYAFRNGWNARAIIAFALGAGLALVGLFVPALSGLYAFNWFLGIAAAGLVYGLLMLPYRSLPTRSRARFADVDPAAVQDDGDVAQEAEVADPVR
ncbi:NCS1 family nucleobase:cation symporter-1 [Zhihengliuella sp. ISTPL4]|uniref:NCS1 family nucleobase:cation symporter-1 n=1 Tax=Zhihengliuella sp. ISTPL4 TaxID=2058657 RepID=UPI000C7E1E7B|nr:cytosine permease [Zhihengliuella sp. ISTPL4]